MGQLPVAVLQSLQSMDEYDRMLAMDRICREHGVSPEQVVSELRALAQGVVQPQTESNEFSPGAYKDEVELDPMAGQPAAQAPRYISDAASLRMRYDPSHDGSERQSQVEQAILCPGCSAPLGIPAQRPIAVTCPNCMMESRFDF